MPLDNLSGETVDILLNAPRILKDLVICKSSRFKYILHECLFDNITLYISGVFIILFSYNSFEIFLTKLI
jgi:hypothetical protein